MASDTGQNKTHEATPRKLEEAQRKGQFVVSSELSSGLITLIGATILWLQGRNIWENIERMGRYWFHGSATTEWTVGAAQIAIHVAAVDMMKIAGPLACGLFLTGIVTSLIQSGFHVTFEPLLPNWEKLSPFSGWSRLFSLRSVIRGVSAILRAAAVGGIAYWIVERRLGLIIHSYRTSLRDLAAEAWYLCMQLAVAVGGCLVLLGLLDLIFQKWKHLQDLRMTLEEVRDEQKQDNGDPHLNARIRKIQREMSQRRMLDDVAGATVVLTNPTHLAVAIRYDRDTMQAPTVVAKGADHLAKRIVERAREHGVPVLERKPLARALYATIEIGMEIPAELYRAIAEVFVYINKIRSAA